MSSLHGKCASCGKETTGSQFCSNLCRLATLSIPKRDSEQFIEANPTLGTDDRSASINIDSVESDLEIAGASLAEIRQISNESQGKDRCELAQYETAFERGRGRERI
jgi:hypothetical protein